jgi:hypothetical protein
MLLCAILLLIVLIILTKLLEPFASYMFDLGDIWSYCKLGIALVLYTFLWYLLYLIVTVHLL